MAKYQFDDPEEAYAEALSRIKQADKDGKTTLNLNSLGLTSVPPEIWQFVQLTRLHLQTNQLTSVPPEIGQLTRLIGLSIRHNQLTSVPPEIGQLAQLETLRLEANQLTSMPPEIGQLDKLNTLELHDNPLNDGMQTAYKRGLPEFLAYLRSLARDAEPLYEAKLVLVGEGAVGKTSLLDALQGRDFVPERPTTHGIEIATEPLDLPHPQIADTNIRLNCWDFGGQRVYRVTHQFFFSRRSLYLLLWSPRMSVEQCDVEGWIKQIRLRVGEGARIIVIATHAETGERVVRIDDTALRRDHGDVIAGFCEIDSRTGYGVAELKELIARTAAELPQMGNPFSARWKAARDEVIRLGKKQPRLEYPRFAEICKSHELDDIDTSTLADFMDILGYVVYFGDDQDLREEMILQPQWLAKAIGYVLEDPETNATKGELSHAWLGDIWSDHGIDGRERYDTELHPYFLRLMEKFDVSYRLDDGQTSLVAQLVPEKRPSLPWSPEEQSQPPPDEAALSLICQMNEAPAGLVPWMIVRSHRFATDPRRHWQRGMFLEHGPHGTAFLELRDREFHFHVRANYPQHFITLLSDSVEWLIEQRWPGLTYDLAVPCPNLDAKGRPCEGRFELASLRHFLADGDKTIRCQKQCLQKVGIAKLLMGFDPPDFDLLERLDQLQASADLARAEQRQDASYAAQMSRTVLRAMTAETRDCPRLFTLIPQKLAKWKPKNLGRDGLRMTLWCEMPDCEHATCRIGSDGSGEYTFTRPQEWLVKVAPYARMISTLLSVAAPIAAASVKAAIGSDTLADVGKSIDLMKEVVGGSLKLGGELAGEIDVKGGPRDADGYRSSAEGAGLRELHSLLLELDPAKTWGKLRRVLTPTGDYLWLCPTHYREYDPGLPVLPTSSDE